MGVDISVIFLVHIINKYMVHVSSIKFSLYDHNNHHMELSDLNLLSPYKIKSLKKFKIYFIYHLARMY